MEVWLRFSLFECFFLRFYSVVTFRRLCNNYNNNIISVSAHAYGSEVVIHGCKIKSCLHRVQPIVQCRRDIILSCDYLTIS